MAKTTLRKKKKIRSKSLTKSVNQSGKSRWGSHRGRHMGLAGLLMRRGLEFFVVASTLFWAIEANATNYDSEGEGSQGDRPTLGAGFDLTRSPANQASRHSHSSKKAPQSLMNLVPPSPMVFHDYSPGLESGESKDFTLMLSKHTQTPQSLLLGDSLASSFKKSPFYIPYSFTLFRFRTF